MSDFTGTKWGDPVVGQAGGQVTWSLATLPGVLYDFNGIIGALEFQNLVRYAFDLWESYANIDFVEVADSVAADVRLAWAQFDGAGGTLGQATVQSTGMRAIYSEVAFDPADQWSVSPAYNGSNFYAVAVHEIGHAIGLDHSSNPNSIMYPYLGDQTVPAAPDIQNIQILYGASLVVGTVVFTGGSSEDVFAGNASANLINGGSGADALSGGLGADNIFGGEGNDLMFGGESGSDPNDVADEIYGGQGADTIYGNGGGDIIYGGDGDGDQTDFADDLAGGRGNDSIFGNGGDDQIFGQRDADSIYGGAGDDYMHGGQENDDLYGGQGNDILVGGRGDDRLTGGVGSDLFVFGSNAGNDVITDFAADDRLNLGGQSHVLAATGGDALLQLSEGGTITLLGVILDDFKDAFVV